MRTINVSSWGLLKDILNKKSLHLQFVDIGEYYLVFAVDGIIFYEYLIYKLDPENSDLIDFETNFKAKANISIAPKLTTDNRQLIKASVRPFHTSGYYTSVDDSMSVYRDVGGGSNFGIFTHNVGDPMVFSIQHIFNVEGNRSWVFEGYLEYKNAENDRFTFTMHPVLTPFTVQSGTNFLRVPSSCLIVPSNGNGDVSIDVSNLTTLVSVVPRTDTGVTPAAFWNASLNTSTMKYENLTPAPKGDGKYNIFYADRCLRRNINKFILTGSRSMYFSTSDPIELGTNLRCVYTFETVGEDHPWSAVINLSMFRERVV